MNHLSWDFEALNLPFSLITVPLYLRADNHHLYVLQGVLYTMMCTVPLGLCTCEMDLLLTSLYCLLTQTEYNLPLVPSRLSSEILLLSFSMYLNF